MTARRPTLMDVADAVGVSKMTVSRALRGAADVSAETVNKVSAAARALGYVGNPLATSLSNRRSGLIGVVVPSLGNIVFADVLAGISEQLGPSAFQPVFGVTDYDPDREFEVVRSMLSWNPTGLIVTGVDQPDQTRALLADSEVPIVQIMDTDGIAIKASVGLSHLTAGARMAKALIENGRKRIGYIGCNLIKDTRAQKRLDGFMETLESSGVTLAAKIQEDGASTISAGRRLTEQMLTAHPGLDGIYFSNDDLAAGAAYHCIAAGFAVPDQIVLAGFNGLEVVRSLPIPIATCVTPRREIGRRAAQLVMETGDDPTDCIQLETKLIFPL